MKTAVIVFPGSNCDRDAEVALRQASGSDPAMVCHKDGTIRILEVEGGKLLFGRLRKPHAVRFFRGHCPTPPQGMHDREARSCALR